jgi:NAD(P)-dependent dehydrogenase (short-subunit alcohol dehydrogenase family)
VVDDVVATEGAVDVLLLPVPPRASARLDDLDLDAWQRTVESVTKRSAALTRSFARHRVERGGGGHLVAFSSSSLFVSPGIGQASVNAAVLSLTSGVATTLVPHGVAVNCVVLGGTDSGQGGVPVPDVVSDEVLASLVVHLSTVDASFTGKFVYCAGRDIGVYAMPFVIEQAHVLVRLPGEPGPDELAEVLAPLADVGRG